MLAVYANTPWKCPYFKLAFFHPLSSVYAYFRRIFLCKPVVAAVGCSRFIITCYFAECMLILCVYLNYVLFIGTSGHFDIFQVCDESVLGALEIAADRKVAGRGFGPRRSVCLRVCHCGGEIEWVVIIDQLWWDFMHLRCVFVPPQSTGQSPPDHHPAKITYV